MKDDLIETYKIISSRESIDWTKPLDQRTRGRGERRHIWTSRERTWKQSKHAQRVF